LVSLMSTPPPSELCTLSLHDALPIFPQAFIHKGPAVRGHNLGEKFFCPLDLVNCAGEYDRGFAGVQYKLCAFDFNAHSSSKNRVDRKSTRLNSSHDQISYAVYCLKKK